MKKAFLLILTIIAGFPAGTEAEPTNDYGFNLETHNWYDPPSPAELYPLPPEFKRLGLVTVDPVPGDLVSFKDRWDQAAAKLVIYGAGKHPAGTMVLGSGTYRTANTIDACDRVSIISNNLNSRGGTVISPAPGFNPDDHLIRVRRSDTRKVNNLWNKWVAAGKPAGKEPRRAPNHNGNFSIHWRNLDFNGTIKDGGRSRGVIWGGAQVSTFSNNYVRYFSGFGLTVGNSACRSTVGGNAFEYCQGGINISSVSTGVRLERNSFLMCQTGIRIYNSDGVRIDGIDTEWTNRVIVLEGPCKNIVATNCDISAHLSGVPIVDLSGLPDGDSDRGIRISGMLRKQQGPPSNPFWLDQNGKKHEFQIRRPQSNNYTAFTIED